ncbi:MAG TPA: PDZ domain-containing protein [Moorella mulderi]|nr:PDZ domain-containing protein [Moorella mulderi]
MNNGRTRWGAWLLLLVFLAGVAVTAGFYHIAGGRNKTLGYQMAEVAPGPVTVNAGWGPETIADIAEKAGPAVVRIDTESSSNPLLEDPFFRYFFGEPYSPLPRVQRGLGSGFIISPDGYILTNQHVIQGATQVKVTVIGFDKPFPARVVGADAQLDLAVLKINADRPLPYLALGDDSQVRVGDWVVAIGNPYGLDHTVTVGVVSAKGRPIDVQGRHYENLLQTDASINPGNSGGPLLNLKGEVIGINTAIKADAQGIGFAIPSSTVKPVLNDLMTKGKIARPWLGVMLTSLTPEVAEFLGLPGPEGALVGEVVAGSPAAEAGLQKYDVILEVDGQKVKDAADLVNKIQSMKIGQKVKLKVFRGGKTLEINATLGEKPSQ